MPKRTRDGVSISREIQVEQEQDQEYKRKYAVQLLGSIAVHQFY